MPYYAIKKTQQIVESWDECQAIIHGMKSPQFKKFKTLEDAQVFLGQKEGNTRANELEHFPYASNFGVKGTITVAGESDITDIPREGLTFAIDGSFNTETAIYGSGMVRLDDRNQITQILSLHGDKEEYAKSRNVAGEVFAMGLAIAEAVKAGSTHITLIHDYKGLYQWAGGKSIKNGWNVKPTSSPIAQRFAKAMQYAAQNGLTTIDFIWVNSHKGIGVNETVDKVAKKACGL